MTVYFVYRYEAAFWAPGEPSNGYRNEYDICIALKSSGDLADWIDADCYEPKGYVCKIEGEVKDFWHLGHIPGSSQSTGCHLTTIRLLIQI